MASGSRCRDRDERRSRRALRAAARRWLAWRLFNWRAAIRKVFFARSELIHGAARTASVRTHHTAPGAGESRGMRTSFLPHRRRQPGSTAAPASRGTHAPALASSPGGCRSSASGHPATLPARPGRPGQYRALLLADLSAASAPRRLPCATGSVASMLRSSSPAAPDSSSGRWRARDLDRRPGMGGAGWRAS